MSVSVLAAAPELTLACLSYLPIPLLHSSPETLPGFSHCPILPAAGHCDCETGTTVSTAAEVGCISTAAAGHIHPQHIQPPPASAAWIASLVGASSIRPLLVSLMQELQVVDAGQGRPCCSKTLSKPHAQPPSAALPALLGASLEHCISQLLGFSS